MKSFKVKKLHLLNKQGWTKEFCLVDDVIITDYLFKCPNCGSEIRIEKAGANLFEKLNLGIEEEEILQYGGAGIISKVTACQNCKAIYIVGIGDYEPNNGRDVFVLNNIIELDEQS